MPARDMPVGFNNPAEALTWVCCGAEFLFRIARALDTGLVVAFDTHFTDTA